MGKDWQRCKLSKIGHSELFGLLGGIKIGKVVNQANLVVPSGSEPLLWAKIGKVANQVKLAFLSHSESFWWEKIGKVANQVKLAILSHSEPLRWENYWKSCKSGEICHFESF